MKRTYAALVFAAVVGLARESAAEVIDRSATGFTIKMMVTTAAPPEAAYVALARHVAEWWDGEHTYSGDSKNLSLIAEAGGCFCEALPNDGAVQHGTVIYVSPGKLLRLSTALGPLQQAGVSGSLTFEFDKDASGGRITMTYSVGGYFPGGLDKVADPVDTVLSRQLGLLKAYADKTAGRR